ncbi:hypothetical protein O6H91_02G150400 [Diphasiastrum complanatum]|uniref:Uncharacterized protein n=3 Tax=Diphasiastrum complanatum TaxID=34168 RepID=A0ACC2ELR7_DIPCM|nr:hypothetical protein O6H91_02G150400 [Diphasiastrum complanatum]KAJ7567493.1 hypothetical protein O6H91_02G150400 [Diphasiastrum complanatum]KAJ7567495.1 hypothetical protein O6H91_02G150400 [Diphasiastrum complanatum]
MQKMGRLSCLRMFTRKNKDKIVEDKETESKQDITTKVFPSFTSPMNLPHPQTATTVSTDMTLVEQNMTVFNVNHSRLLNSEGKGSDADILLDDTKVQPCGCKSLSSRSGDLAQLTSRKIEAVMIDIEMLTNQAFSSVSGDLEHEQDCEKESSLLTPLTIEDESSKLASTVTDDHVLGGKVTDNFLLVDNGSPRHYCGSHQSASIEGCDARSADIHNISGHLSDPGLYHSKYLESTFGSPIIGCISSCSRFEDEGEYRRKDLENNRVLNVTSYQTADSSPLELLPDDNTANAVSNDSQPREHICELQRQSILLSAKLKDAEGVRNEMAGCATCISKMTNLKGVSGCSEKLSWHQAETSSEQSGIRPDSKRHAMDKDSLRLASSSSSFTKIIESCTFEVLPPKESIKFSGYSGFKRVEEWVNSVDPVAVPPNEKPVTVGAGCDSPSLKPSQQSRVHNLFAQRTERDIADGPNNSDINMMADLDVANTVARSVTSLATIAHLSGFGLRVVPMLGALTSLKILNLSSNAIGLPFCPHL